MMDNERTRAELLNDSAEKERAGQKLQQARLSAGLSLTDIARYTNIAERYLKSIENGRFNELASTTYAIGFARSYARALKIDEDDIVSCVKAEIEQSNGPERVRPTTMEPGDPSRIPGPRLAWAAALGAVVVMAAVFMTWRNFYDPAAPVELLAVSSPPANKTAVQNASTEPSAYPAETSENLVKFTATQPDIWVKFYDASGVQIMQKHMAQGETFTLPADVDSPKLWTGRPDALAITLNDKPIPPIAAVMKTVKDVPVSYSALLSRAQADEAGSGVVEQ